MSTNKRFDSGRSFLNSETLLLAGGFIPFLALTVSVIEAMAQLPWMPG
jgi:hypothetical protein